MEITCQICKPRRARESPLYRLVEQHLEELLRVWPERFDRTHGPLRPVVERVLREFLHIVMTIPRLLRPLFRRRRDLLRHLACCAADALGAYMEASLGEALRPGIVVSIATAGDLAQWHPHLHMLATDGGFSPEGSFHPHAAWDGEGIMTLFRQALLERLVAKHAISEELKARLLSWRHPGFSVHVGRPTPPNDTRAIEDMASYVVRNPVSLRRLVYIDGHKAVIYRALRTNPNLAANFVALDPLEWLARITDHIPDPGRHRTLFYAHYANRARGVRAKEKKLSEAVAPAASPDMPRKNARDVGTTPQPYANAHSVRAAC